MKNTALLIIDVQDSFYHTTYFQADKLELLKQPLVRLIDKCMTHKVPILRILHAELDDKKSPWHPETGNIKSMDFLPDCFTRDFTKHVHNAFTDTELADWLREQDIERLLVSGIRTEQCCETTARVASDLGFKVDFVIDATTTFDMIDHEGHTVTSQEIKKNTRLVLENRFAKVINVDDLDFND